MSHVGHVLRGKRALRAASELRESTGRRATTSSSGCARCDVHPRIGNSQQCDTHRNDCIRVINPEPISSAVEEQDRQEDIRKVEVSDEPLV